MSINVLQVVLVKERVVEVVVEVMEVVVYVVVKVTDICCCQRFPQ